MPRPRPLPLGDGLACHQQILKLGQLEHSVLLQ